MKNENFQWEQHPKAEAFINDFVQVCCTVNVSIASLQSDLLKHTSTRLFDWVDHIVVKKVKGLQDQLEEIGFELDLVTQSYRVFHHPGAQLPRIMVKDHDEATLGVAVSVESIENYLMVRGIHREIEGSPFSHFRRCCISTEENHSLWVVERRACLSMEPVDEDEGYINKYMLACEKWNTRPRLMQEDDEAMRHTIALVEDIVSLLGKDLAAWIVLEGERKYWQSRNGAGQIQKNRQDRWGMGWANHDHHTFRSSRKHFQELVRIFEMLGFHCRERFYAGEEAGWGAQVMENSNCGLVLFLDVDLDPHEISIDFSHQPLPVLDKLGTIGLWCALHGDSILRAGMHHLEAQFLFEELTSDLLDHGVGMMEPFSNFEYLKQAFTSGEVWTVDSKRIDRLLESGKISTEEAKKFKTYGAVGSHLENLQRRNGYKGFNQKNVSFIIQKTDPRTIQG
ncbi:MAG: hypothetical protein VX777_10370 [Chlamydiota bacterium]|nr:hypothetical protein [Chlamydiota bacterium]